MIGGLGQCSTNQLTHRYSDIDIALVLLTICLEQNTEITLE